MKSNPDFTICPACDLVQTVTRLEPGESLHCVRCSEELACGPFNKYELVWAMLITSTLLIVVMNVFPLVEIRVGGNSNVTTLLGAIHMLYAKEMPLLSLLVLATTVIVPAIEIVLLALIFTPSTMFRLNIPGSLLVRLVHLLRTWSMVEVFMLGVLVSLVKLAALAEIILGPATWACVGLIVVLALLKALIRAEQLWCCYQREYQ